MASASPGSQPASGLASAGSEFASAEGQLRRLSDLLASVEHPRASRSAPLSGEEAAHEAQLAMVRLGMASSLFQALRARHAPTAAHCLRVALGCSSWALSLELTDRQRDEIEVAALLHDVGKVGVPDHVLLKPGKLLGEEVQAMEQHASFGRTILQSCCASVELLETYRYIPAWYSGSRQGFDRSGDRLPLGSRMIAIVDAFDAMTTDHAYRRAMPRERAMAELFEYAGGQFDPSLVKDFHHLVSRDRVQLHAGVARRWLRELQPQSVNDFWERQPPSVELPTGTLEQRLQQKLIENMHDGVVLVDGHLQILQWNRAAERLTGISSESVRQRRWEPGMIDLRDENGRRFNDQDCPLAHAVRTGVQIVRRSTLAGRKGERVSVDLHGTPVLSHDGRVVGATLLVHDASSQITLEERVQSLHAKATRDPLTNVANRAEFNRVHELFVVEHLERGLPCSLVICDLDHFKKINDTYGHPAGDAALISFASLLQRHGRKGDLVARYGGEEFVMLCADCDNATATARAEEVRRQLAAISQPALGGASITASFGVTELQAGDTPETMLRRADRGLLEAKGHGRNMVVQLGSGITGLASAKPQRGWWSLFRRVPAEQVLCRGLTTSAPLKVTAEKLRGFIADHHAEILSLEENQAILGIEGKHSPLTRRASDRPIPFFVELQFQESGGASEGKSAPGQSQTNIRVTISPKRHRDRRSRDVVERARQLLMSLKAYLMAYDAADPPPLTEPVEPPPNVWSKARSLLEHLVGR